MIEAKVTPDKHIQTNSDVIEKNMIIKNSAYYIYMYVAT